MLIWHESANEITSTLGAMPWRPSERAALCEN